jgi:hypothetical protein
VSDGPSLIGLDAPSVDWARLRPRKGVDRPIPVPSTWETVRASFNVAQADQTGDDEQAVIDAYRPLINELSERGNAESRYIVMARGVGRPINEDVVWADIARARQTDPKAFAGVAKDRAAFRASALAQYRATIRRDEETVSRGGTLATLAGGAAASLVDPINVGTMFIGGGGGTIARRIATEALVNAGTELAQQPLVAAQRAKTGRTLSGSEAATNVLFAGLGGVAFQGVAEGGKALVRPASTLAARMRETIPWARMTAGEQAAVRTLEREDAVVAQSPFRAGRDTEQFAEMVETKLAAVKAGAPLAEPVAPAPAPRRPARDLSIDAVFTNTLKLEGGATVVRYGDVDGSTTKYGIAAKFNRGVDVANLTEGQARDIMRRKYWLPEFDRVDPRTAAVAFDAGFVAGPKTARRILRESGGDADRALELYRAHLNHIADTVPGKARWRKGWNRRVDGMARFVGDGDGVPQLRRDVFPEGDAGHDEWAAAQREVEAAEAASRAWHNEDRPIDAADDIPFGDDDPRVGPPAARDSDPFAFLDETDAPDLRARMDASDDAPKVVRPETDDYAPPARVDEPDEALDAMEGSARDSDDPIDVDAPDYVPPAAMPRTDAGIPQERLTRADASAEAEWLRAAWRSDMAAGRAAQPVYAVRPVAGGEMVLATPSYSLAHRTMIDPPGPGEHEIVKMHPPEDVGELAKAQAAPLTAFDDPAGDGVTRQIDSLEHDLRMFLLEDEAQGLTVRLDEEGDVVSAADVLAEIDGFEADIAAARACMAPPAQAAA